MTSGERVKKYREKLGISQDELAERLGYKSRATIYKIEKGINDIPFNKIESFAKALCVDIRQLLYDEDELIAKMDPTMVELFDGDIDALIKAASTMSIPPELLGKQNDPLPPDVIPIPNMPHHSIPVLGEVAAGQPIFAEESYDAYIDGPEKADFALKVKGDSMVPTFLDGDVVYIKSTPDVANGTVAVIIIDDSATLKHVYKSDNIITLISDNPAYEPMVVNLAEHDYVRIIGKVCGYTRMFRK